jgi:uncharacterized protein (DUF3820 family)
MKSQPQFTLSGHHRQRRKHQAPSALATFPLSFGRYRDVPLSKIPTSYLRWMVRTESIPDVDRWAVQQYLQAVATPRRHRRGRRQEPGHRQETTTPAGGTVGAAKSNN